MAKTELVKSGQPVRLLADAARDILWSPAPDVDIEALKERGLPTGGNTIFEALFCVQVGRGLEGNDHSFDSVVEIAEPKISRLEMSEERVEWNLDDEDKIATVIRRQLTLSVGSSDGGKESGQVDT